MKRGFLFDSPTRSNALRLEGKRNSVALRGCSEPAQINVNRLPSRNLMNVRSLGDLVIKTLIHHDEVTMYKEILDR